MDDTLVRHDQGMYHATNNPVREQLFVSVAQKF